MIESARLSVSEDFVRRFGIALDATVVTIKNLKPDLIIAHTRKAPRLIELMRINGIWNLDVPIITERAIDFISADVLKDKKVIVFDDIIICGSTIYDLLIRLQRKFNSSFEVVCVAIDGETIAVTEISKAKYAYIIDNKSIPIHYGESLSSRERFFFCNRLVRWIASLSKPYDLDHCIFYAQASHEVLSDIIRGTNTTDPFASENSDKLRAYDITTLDQERMGLERYTLIEGSKVFNKQLARKILRGVDLDIQLCKIRIYYDGKSERIGLVPMILCRVAMKAISKDEIFSDSFSEFNEIMHLAKALVDPHQEETSLYRVFCYLMSYLYGISSIERLRKRDEVQIFSDGSPSSRIHKQDLIYLFGNRLADAMISSLDACSHKTLMALKKILDGISEEDIKEIESAKESECNGTKTFDPRRIELLSIIQPYIDENLPKDDLISDKLATIFEGMYYGIEVPREKNLRKNGLSENSSKRLDSGFNFIQLKNILSENEPEIHKLSLDVSLSLALDFLVDAGVQVPLYYRTSDNFMERAFRYGEDGLSARQYYFLTATILRDLFSYAGVICGSSIDNMTIDKTDIEKIGVIIRETILGEGLVDVLRRKLPIGDRDLEIAPTQGLRGRVLKHHDEGHDSDMSSGGELYTEWCLREGILLVGGEKLRGVKYNTEFDTKNKQLLSSNEIPILTLNEKIAKLQSIATLLYHVASIRASKELPFSGTDHLVALTTCCDHQSYLNQIREQLRLFFKSSTHKMEDVFRMDNAVLAWKEIKQIKIPIHGANLKIKLWERIDDIVKNIDSRFSNDITISRVYAQNLKPLMDRIIATHGLEIPFDVVECKRIIERFSYACIDFSEIVENFMALKMCHLPDSMIREITNKMSDRKRKEIAKIRSKKHMDYLDVLITSMRSWNEKYASFISENSGGESMNCIGFRIEDSWYSQSDTENGAVKLLSSIDSAIKDVGRDLENIYDTNYSQTKWKDTIGKLSEIFPRGFPEERQFIKSQYGFIVWYDLKDSSGQKIPWNSVRAAFVEKKLNEELPRFRTMINNDGRFREDSENDEKYIYVKKSPNTRGYIEIIKRVCMSGAIYARFTIASTYDINDSLYEDRFTGNMDIQGNKRIHIAIARITSKTKDHGGSFRLIMGLNSAHEVFREDMSLLEKTFSDCIITPICTDGLPIIDSLEERSGKIPLITIDIGGPYSICIGYDIKPKHHYPTVTNNQFDLFSFKDEKVS